MGVERVGVGQGEVERQRLAGDLDINTVAGAPGRRRRPRKRQSRALGRLFAEHRHRGAEKERAAVARGRQTLDLLDRAPARGDLDDAAPRRTHRADQRVELGEIADRRRHRHASPARMVERIGRAKPDRAGLHRLADQPFHLGELGHGRLLAGRRLLAHHRGAHRRMPDQHRDVGIGRAAAHRRHVLGKGLKAPVDAGAQRVQVHAFDDREVAHDQNHAALRRARRNAEAAIADHRRGDAK